MRVGQREIVLADLADELALGIELEQLRGRGHVGRPGHVAAREDEDVSLRVDRDAGDLAEVNVRRKRQRIGNRFKRQLRNRGRRLRGHGGHGPGDERDGDEE